MLLVGAGHNPYAELVPAEVEPTITDFDSTLPGIHMSADLHCLPFTDAAFDAVVAIEVLEHIQSPLVAVTEIHRVLTHGGMALVTTPFLFHIHGDPMDFNRFTKSGLEQLLGSFGSVHVRGYGNRLHVMSDLVTTAWRPLALFRAGNHLLARGPLGRLSSSDCPSGYIAVATK